ncbi:MAG: oligosaccharide flippase family protein [Deltaproteobacteria bacterium]|uniref:lipopolysaccharide biosynthesis protein n=1 Tax=Desulfobacula sp. TaxID=2593537 RepID=UPI00198C8EF6|nr:oligosaccharide flippase family protein [Candidatus Desulfobacula maris]MBL6995851.1 oligosaccharide flippase family protein [Desulfobacula sp.]
MMRNDKIKVFIEYISVLVGSGFLRFISFVTLIIITKSLTVEKFGEFSLFITIMMFCWQLTAPLDLTYVKFACSQVDDKAKVSYLRDNLVFKICFILFIFLLCYPLSYTLAFVVFQRPGVVVWILIALLTGALLSISSSYAATFQVEKRFGAFSVVNSAFNIIILLVILTIFFLKSFLSLPILSFSYLGVSIFLVITMCSLIYKKFDKLFHYNNQTLGESFHFVKWIIVSNVFKLMANRMDIFLLGRFVSFYDLGLYSAAVRFSALAMLFVGTIMPVFITRVTNALTSPENFKQYLKESLLILSCIAFVILILIRFSPFLITLLFGEKYNDSFQLTNILLIQVFISGMCVPPMAIFYGLKLPSLIMKFEFLFFFSTIFLVFIFVKFFGVFGAAWGLVFSSFIYFLTLVLFAMIKIRAIFHEQKRS